MSARGGPAEWEPRIIVFCCNWCSYAGADLAGVSRLQMPSNFRVIRTMCSGRISPYLVIRLLREGADGVMIAGCHLGDCHYISGNYYTEKRFALLQKMLEHAGLETERIALEWVSASEGEKFSRIIADFTTKMIEMGPSPVSTNADVANRLKAIENATRALRVTVLVSREYNLLRKGDVYGEIPSEEKTQSLIDAAAKEEFERAMILTLTDGKNMSVKELSKVMSVPSDRVLEHIVSLRQNNLISMDHPEKGSFTPTYLAITIGGD